MAHMRFAVIGYLFCYVCLAIVAAGYTTRITFPDLTFRKSTAPAAFVGIMRRLGLGSRRSTGPLSILLGDMGPEALRWTPIMGPLWPVVRWNLGR
jgi:hypothetical protein